MIMITVWIQLSILMNSMPFIYKATGFIITTGTTIVGMVGVHESCATATGTLSVAA
jgi:hypothetical protein